LHARHGRVPALLTPPQLQQRPATQSPLESAKAKAFPPNHAWDRNFFLVMVGLAWVGIIKGFGGSIANHLAKHQAPYPLIVHFHAVVFVSWLVLFTVQVLLIRFKRVSVHKRLGIAMVWLAGLMVILGPSTALTVQHRSMDQPNADPAFLSVQFTDILAFSGLVATRRRLHPAYVIGVAWVLANQMTAMVLYRAPFWLAFSKKVIAHRP
jgi:hypothetical protein